ncbi:MAG: TonB-dependent receptor [Proteobacteria bacterium]|nr:TonB-dependent receptor [Pseudomonadota bacterium]
MRVFVREIQSKHFQALLVLAACLPLATLPQQAHAQASDANEEVIEEIVITGTRRAVGSVTDMPSPVDILPADALQNQGLVDMQDILRTLVPSFTVTSHPLSGTSSLVRPPNLRGLGADQTLVLVNGKRRHRAANIPNFSGGINRGTQGPDISNIPAISLKSVEVLRDGASAQYGADAIAGVINFILNDDPNIRHFSIQAGSYYDGDGDSIRVSGIVGFPIGDGGSLNVSAEYKDSDATVRVQQPSSRQAFTDAGWPDIPNPSFRWGNPEVQDDISAVVNLVAPIAGQTEIYGYASYNNRTNISPFFNRDPFRAGWFTVNDPVGGNNFLVFDTTAGGTGGCPLIPVPDLADSVATAAAAAAVAALSSDPDCFSFLEIYPGGITPDFGGENDDLAGSLGVRGTIGEDLDYDVSLTYGRNEVTYTAINNASPTFGPLSPTTLLAGSRIQKELTANAQITFPWDIGNLASPINVAAGLEWHEEDYEQVPGQLESYGVGPFTDPVGPATTGVGVGTRGFGSFSPATSLQEDRSNYAVYVDLEADVTDDWVLGIALRYEDFTDLGDDTNFKVSTLYHVTDAFSIRATYSTGFHAPTPGQQVNAQSTVAFNAAGVLTTTGLLPPAVAGQLPSLVGLALPLTPETADNLSFGFIWEGDIGSLTIDFYQIEVENRIAQTGATPLTDADRAALFALGFTNANEFTGVAFFTNDFDTETQGVDIVASMPLEFSESGNTLLSAAFNYNDTEVTRRGAALGDWRLATIENDIPNWRGNISMTHQQGPWRGLVRLNYYGSFTEFYLNTSRITNLDSQITVDLEAGYFITDNIEISVGAQNAFDSVPTIAFTADAFGNTYPVASPAGFSGGFYYARVALDFGGN